MPEVKKGQILRLTGGCYSDWNIHKELLVLQDFDVSDRAKEFGKTLQNLRPYGYWDDEFSEWLKDRGLVSFELPQETVEVHLGDYDALDFYGPSTGAK